MTTNHDYEAAIIWMDLLDLAFFPSLDIRRDIIHALRFAQKMMQEPSAMMILEGTHRFPNEGFKAMVNQALKEMEG